MKTDIVCFFIPIFGIIASIRIIRRFKLDKKVVKTGLIVGVIISSLNILLEYAGAELDIYYVSGPFRIIRSPLPLSIGWVFLTFLFCSGYELIARGRGSFITLLYITTGIVIGCFIDFSFYRFFEILTLGEKGSPLLIALIWIIFVPVTVSVYDSLLRRVLS